VGASDIARNVETIRSRFKFWSQTRILYFEADTVRAFHLLLLHQKQRLPHLETIRAPFIWSQLAEW
jgi:hypothetical protein